MSSSDVSAVTNYFSTAAEGFNTTLSSTISSAATSVPLTSTAGLTNGAVFVGIIEPGQTAQQTFTGTVDVSGSQITNVKWVRGTNVGHAGGVTIVDYVSGAAHNMTTAGIMKQHTQAGAHTGITTDTIATAGNVTVGGTLGVTGTATLTGAVGGAGYSMATMDNPYKFSVYRNAAYTAGNSFLVLTFDAKTYDTGSNVDVVTNKGRFTAPIAGFYHFSAAFHINSLAGGAGYGIALYKNGAIAKQGNEAISSSAGAFGTCPVVSGNLQLAVNDYVEVYAYGSSSAITTGAVYNYFDGFLVSKT